MAQLLMPKLYKAELQILQEFLHNTVIKLLLNKQKQENKPNIKKCKKSKRIYGRMVNTLFI